MSAWKRELGITLLLCLGVIIVGSLTGWLIPLLLVTLIGLLLWQIYQTNRFRYWLSQGAKGKYPPKAKGVWEDIYYHVYLIKKRERRRKKKLGKIIDQFRKSTDALPDAAIVLGKYDEIEWANTAAKDWFGLKASDRGQRLPNLIRSPAFVSYLNSNIYDEGIVLPSPTNPKITLSMRVIQYGAGLRLLLAQNITQLKKMELIRKDFVANVSHELRTPLTVIKGYLETLREEDGQTLSPVSCHSLKLMQEQTERMQLLVDDLLLLSKLETQPRKHQCVDIPKLVEKISHESAKANNSGRIEISLGTEFGLVGAELELHSAVANLLNNALKYSPTDSVVKVSWQQTDKHLILTISDQGEGIPEEEIARITERFYRVNVKRSQPVPGTGLGLAIVKHVLIRHDAELAITSIPGNGSTFSCLFPIARKCKTNRELVDAVVVDSTSTF